MDFNDPNEPNAFALSLMERWKACKFGKDTVYALGCMIRDRDAARDAAKAAPPAPPTPEAPKT